MTKHPRAARLQRWSTIATVLICARVAIDGLFCVPSLAGFLEVGDDGAGLLSVLVALGGLMSVYFAAMVSFLVWLNIASKNMRIFAPDGAYEFSSGWAVGWWFVPLANLARPLAVVKEIWSASSSTKHHEPTSLVEGWWAAWVLTCIADRVVAQANVESTAVSVALMLPEVVAAILCVLVMRRLTEMQLERFEQPIAVSQAVGHVVGAAPTL